MIDTGRDKGLLTTTALLPLFSFLWSPSSESGWKDLATISTVNQCVLLHFFSFDHRKGLSKVPQIKSSVFGFPPLRILRGLIFAKKLFVFPKYFQAQNSAKGCRVQNIHIFLKLPFLSFTPTQKMGDHRPHILALSHPKVLSCFCQLHVLMFRWVVWN